MSVRRLALSLCLTATTGILSAQANHGVPREQTEFSAESAGVDRPVTIPDDVLKQLARDDFVLPAATDTDPPVQTPPSTWFSASIVHLTRPEKQDLVIMGQGPLAGANVIMFWIFRDTGHGYDLALRTGGHDLHVKRHPTNGYRDLEADSVTLMQFHSVLYCFDGNRYVIHREKTEPIK